MHFLVSFDPVCRAEQAYAAFTSTAKSLPGSQWQQHEMAATGRNMGPLSKMRETHQSGKYAPGTVTALLRKQTFA